MRTDSKTLAVPLGIEAWVVNQAVLTGDPIKHPEKTIGGRFIPFYKALLYFKSPTQNATRQQQDDIKQGVYLHWTLPHALRHKQVNGQFPAVPNRWLVVRYYGPPQARLATAWVVESDYISEDDTEGGSPFPNPKRVGQIHVGRAIPLAEWKETALSGLNDEKFLPKLDAVSNGDIHFSMYQPYCQNIFSFVDSEIATTTDPTITQYDLSYFISGWYSDPAQDPLASFLKSQDLSSLGWQLPKDSKETPQRILCHGIIYGVKWPGNDVIPPSIQDQVHLEKMQIAVGSSALDALNTLITSQGEKSIPKELLEAFQHGLLQKVDEVDGDVELAEHMHQAEFGRHPGGIIWTVKSSETKDSNQAASLLDLTDDEAKSLDELNQQQLQLTVQQHLLEKAQWDLYALWWKLGNKKEIKTEQPDLVKQLDATSSGSLANKIQLQKKSIQSLQANLNKAQDLLTNALKPHKKTLKAINRPPFWKPQDPVVLIKGIKSPSWTPVTIKQLPCRFFKDCVSSLQEDKDHQVTGQSISLPEIKNMAALPIRPDPLLIELFLLDPTNADSLAAKIGMSVEDLRKLMQQHNPANYTGILPVYGLNPWSQAWFPLLVEWNIEWYTSPYRHWQFAEDGYKLTSVSKEIVGPQTVTGHSFLIPQASFTFKGQLKRLMDQFPLFAKSFPDWQALESIIDNWDILSLTLGGLHEQWLQLDHQMNRVPHAENKDEKPLCDLIGKQAYCTPIPGIADLFQPVCHGQFYISRLSVIDRFGQMINVIQPQSIYNIPIYVSDYLKLNTDSLRHSKKIVSAWVSPSSCVQLTPRIVQPSRLDCDWLVADKKIDSTQRLLTHCKGNPIAGWLLPNYFNQSLQAFDPQGHLLGELCLQQSDSGASSCIWQPAPFQPYADLNHLSQDYPWLGRMLQALENQSVDAYNALKDIIDTAFRIQKRTLSQYTPYLSTLAGRPLALARAFWQLELARPTLSDQSWENLSSKQFQYQFDKPEEFPSFNPDYKFPLQLGSNNPLKHDGLIGYFAGADFTKFYSLYRPTTSSGYALSTLDAKYTLMPTNPGLNQSNMATVLLDPFAKIHAYTDILPLKSLELPAIFVEPSLKQMSMTFRMGPLLTISSAIYLPQPSVKGNWSWLAPQKNGLQKKELRSSDTTARPEGQSSEMIEGLLMFNHPFTEKKLTASGTPHPQTLLTTTGFWATNKTIIPIEELKTPPKTNSGTIITKTSQPVLDNKKRKKWQENKKTEIGYFYNKNQLIPFSIIKIPGDGNCLFTATATAINTLKTSDRQNIAKRLSDCLSVEVEEVTQQTLRMAIAATVKKKITTHKEKEIPEIQRAALDLLEQKSRLLRPMIQAIGQEINITKRQKIVIVLVQTIDLMQEKDIHLSEIKETGQYPSEQTEIVTQIQRLVTTLKNISKTEGEQLKQIVEKIQNPQDSKRMDSIGNAALISLYPEIIIITGVWGDHFEMVCMNEICGIHLDPHQKINISREFMQGKIIALLAHEQKNDKKETQQKIKKELQKVLLAAYRNQLPASINVVIRTNLEGVTNGVSTLQEAQSKINHYLTEKEQEANQLYLNWFVTSRIPGSRLEEDIFLLCCEEKGELKNQGLSNRMLKKIREHDISLQALYLPLGASGASRTEELKMARSKDKIIIETLFISQSHYDVPGQRHKPISLQVEKPLSNLNKSQTLRRGPPITLSQSGNSFLVKKNKSLTPEKLPPVPVDIKKESGINAFADLKFRQHFYPLLDKFSSLLASITVIKPATKPHSSLSLKNWPLCKTNYPDYLAAYIAIPDISKLNALVKRINEIVKPDNGFTAKILGQYFILYFHKNCPLATVLEQLQIDLSTLIRTRNYTTLCSLSYSTGDK